MARRLLTIPRDQDNVVLHVDGKDVRLTNLRKIFWTELGLTKGDLLRYYASIADVLLPHLRDRAMVMKRYPRGAACTSTSIPASRHPALITAEYRVATLGDVWKPLVSGRGRFNLGRFVG